MDKVEIICTVIGTAIALISSTVAAIAWGFKHYAKKESERHAGYKRIEELESKYGKLPCESHNNDITAIKSIIVLKHPNSANVFSMKASPRKLNEMGMRIYKEIQGEEFICSNKEILFRYISENKPLKALDVERLSYEALAFNTNNEMFNSIKDYVYNVPSITLDGGKRYDITLNDVCFILSIPLRDMYLNVNKDIN